MPSISMATILPFLRGVEGGDDLAILTPSWNTNLCVDVPGGDAYDGAPLWLWECYGGESQQWLLTDEGDHLNEIRYGADPSFCLTHGNEVSDGPHPVWPTYTFVAKLGDCQGGSFHQWQWWRGHVAGNNPNETIVSLEDGGHNDACLMKDPQSQSNGQPLLVSPCTSDASGQKFEHQFEWAFSPVAPAPDPTPAPAPTPGPAPAPAPAPSPAPDPTPPPAPSPATGYQIQSLESHLCMDLKDGDTSNGAHLWTVECTGGENQQWSFHNGQLVYMPDTSKCVDLLGGYTKNGNKLGLWDCLGNDSQQWGFDPEQGTIYLASSAASDATKCMMIGTGPTANILIWDCNGHTQEFWSVGAPSLAVAVV